MTNYGFIYIHDDMYPVYNDLDILFGKDKEYYRTIYIPIVGNIELGDNLFIKSDADNYTEYTVQIDYDEYEIRSDKEIRVESIEGINYIVLTTNQTAIAVRNDRMKNILLWCKKAQQHVGLSVYLFLNFSFSSGCGPF